MAINTLVSQLEMTIFDILIKLEVRSLAVCVLALWAPQCAEDPGHFMH